MPPPSPRRLGPARPKESLEAGRRWRQQPAPSAKVSGRPGAREETKRGGGERRADGAMAIGRRPTQSESPSVVEEGRILRDPGLRRRRTGEHVGSASRREAVGGGGASRT
ncbi:Hypothetical predicted protein [Podarcis lilfordi]|uniref:Uncharacterized protein n=1 Tax=Podarcis lilfordi TaxID=74358 RepID=A0AA35PAT2_9SAUR|nr:Hypothetical predicted protein [Podarcis lilfordi]